MIDNSKENIPNRKKVNYKNYKDACKGMDEPEYKRGSKEKEEQIRRWESKENLFKQKDNSFTYINPEFKNKKQRDKKQKREEKTKFIDNHSVFLGQGKYKFEEFESMKEVFLNFIDTSKATTKGAYINDFYRSCYLFKAIEDVDFKKEVSESKAKSIAWDILYSECRYVFDQFLKYCKEELETFIAYYDKNNEWIDFYACEFAWIMAVKILDFKYMDYKTRIEELYEKINEILVDNDLEPIRRRETIYCVATEDYRNNNVEHLTDVTKLYEIIKLVVTKKIGKRSVVLGKPRNIKYNLTPVEYKEALEFIKEYVCYYDEQNGQKYYSVEDILKTEVEKITV